MPPIACLASLRPRLAACALTVTFTLLMFVGVVSPVYAQFQITYTLHIFRPVDGVHPLAALIQGRDGNFYGTTLAGGDNYDGTVFKMDSSGNVTFLHSFNGTDGAYPSAALIQGKDGSFYGTTLDGGVNSRQGTVFKIDAAGNFTLLHSFDGTDGWEPSGLIQGNDGFFYGTTYIGGANGGGTVFKIDTAGHVTTLHAFGSLSEGANPTTSLIQGNDGCFYGTTLEGGTNGDGTVFKMDAAGNFTVLHSFDGTFYVYPNALIQGSDGSFYGTTQYGGSNGYGTVFKIDTAGNFTVLHSFGIDGPGPSALIQGSDGFFYGNTSEGGSSGTVFKMDAAGNVTVLYFFSAYEFANGANPYAALIQGSDGYLYGMTGGDGPDNEGSVFKIDTAGNLTFLHWFGYFPDGNEPMAALLQGSDGFFYGTTRLGGANGYGTVFKTDAAGNFTVLHSFDYTEGIDPETESSDREAALIEGRDGFFYGTAIFGGTYGYGTAFRMDAAGNITVLHAFNFPEGANPNALIQASDDSFYGTTQQGGTNGYGSVFKMDASGNVFLLHSFSGTDGANPYASLIQGSDGNFYGTTAYGGVNNQGTVLKMDTAGNVTTLHSFNGTDGSLPLAPLIQASDGNFYGTTSGGGVNGNYGAVFRIDTAGNYTLLHSFNGKDGNWSYAPLLQASDGFFYGTTKYGGYGTAYDWTSGYYGTVFEMDMAGNFAVLHAFQGDDRDGAFPVAALIQGNDGNLYGTTSQGGDTNYTNPEGIIFKLFLPQVSVAGKLSLQGCVNLVQPITFTFRSTNGGPTLSRPFILNSDGSFTLSNIPRGGTYNLAIKGSKWLRKVIPVTTTSGDVSGLSVTLLAGDVNGDNQVSLADYVLLRNAFGSRASSANWKANADLNCDGQVSLADYVLLRNNFGKKGDP